MQKKQCVCCGTAIIPMPAAMVEKIYGKAGDDKDLSKMCPQCRRKRLWERWVLKG